MSGIDRSRLAIAGRTRLKVLVRSTKALLDFAVIEDGSIDLLIGSPGLNHLGVTISNTTKSITCKHGDKVPFPQHVPTDDVVRLEHELTVQPGTGVPVNTLFASTEVGQTDVFTWQQQQQLRALLRRNGISSPFSLHPS